MDHRAVVPNRFAEGAARIAEDLRKRRAAEAEKAKKAAYYASLTGWEPPVPNLSQRQEWTFKDMCVGEVETFTEPWIARARAAAHTCGSKKGFKFKTYTVDGVLFIKRIA